MDVFVAILLTPYKDISYLDKRRANIGVKILDRITCLNLSYKNKI